MYNRREFLEDYYAWLISLVGGDLPPYNEYALLLRKLYSKTYVWQEWNLSVIKDSNRALDGLTLRNTYIDIHYGGNPYLLEMFNGSGCSVLEMLIALSKHAEFDMTLTVPDNSVGKWFWIMLQNLGLLRYSDDAYVCYEVESILNAFLSRAYDNHGVGSIFYIRKPPKSCRETELYYQLEWYLNENYKI